MEGWSSLKPSHVGGVLVSISVTIACAISASVEVPVWPDLYCLLCT